MLIKLESGDYVDTYYIERLWMVNERDGYIRFANNPDVQITKNDYGLIVKAMEPNYLEEYDAVLPDDMPVIPKEVGEYIRKAKAPGKWGLLDVFWHLGDNISAVGINGLYDWQRWMADNQVAVARAWVLGVWSIEETGEIVKLEAEK